MPRIFISYRREDSSSVAGRIYDRLADVFGAGNVFMDVDDIAPGEDFVDAIERRIKGADTLIAVIGSSWSVDPKATAELSSEDNADYVRHEIASALKTGMRVVPVLVEDTMMPAAGELPQSLKKLARLQALTVTHARFKNDVSELVRILKHNAAPTPLMKRPPMIAATGAGIILLTVAASPIIRNAMSNFRSGEISPSDSSNIGQHSDSTLGDTNQSRQPNRTPPSNRGSSGGNVPAVPDSGTLILTTNPSTGVLLTVDGSQQALPRSGQIRLPVGAHVIQLRIRGCDNQFNERVTILADEPIRRRWNDCAGRT